METIVALLLAVQATPTDLLVEKGTAYLKTRSGDLGQDPEFSLWILISVGASPSERTIAALHDAVLRREPATTRSAALQAMALEAIDPARYQMRILHCAQFLIDNQCADGRWDAGKPIAPLEVYPPQPKPAPRGFNPPRVLQKIVLKQRAAGGATGDSVLSRWAAWGVQACHRAGMVFPGETLERAATSWRKGEHDPADVVSSLSIYLDLKKQNVKADRDVLRAVDRLAIRDPRTDPASLFVLKRAMVQFGSSTLGGRDWWQDGVKVLAAAQTADGGWGPVEDTGYATGFLRR